MVLRSGTSHDFDAVRRLAERKSYPRWPSQGPEESGPAALESRIASSDFKLEVTEESGRLTGFLLLRKQLVRGLTGDRESVIEDWFALHPADAKRLLEGAVEAARGYQSQFLTIQLAPGSEHRELFTSLGFHLESHRISVPTGECRLPRESPYAVRPVEEEDAYLIAVLNSTMLGHTLSAGREYDLFQLTFQSMEAIMTRVTGGDPRSAGLALTLDGTMVGHLLLELDDRMGYIYDLALAQEHWGGTAVRHLMREGSRLLFERGVPLFVGDVSASNRRALIVAQRALGFTVDCERYGLPL